MKPQNSRLRIATALLQMKYRYIFKILIVKYEHMTQKYFMDLLYLWSYFLYSHLNLHSLYFVYIREHTLVNLFTGINMLKILSLAKKLQKTLFLLTIYTALFYHVLWAHNKNMLIELFYIVHKVFCWLGFYSLIAAFIFNFYV